MSAGLYFSHPACLEHDPRVHSPGHPDTPERLLALERALAERDWLGWERREAPAASEARARARAHARRTCARSGSCALPAAARSTPTRSSASSSFRAALHAAGGACAMTRALLAGEATVGFCAVRPSGHHAEAAARDGLLPVQQRRRRRRARDRRARAASACSILDWDVHHGNGTAEIFRDRADVLFASIHQTRLYPGTGALERRRLGRGRGLHDQPARPAGLRASELWLSLLEQRRAAGGGRVRARAGAGLGRLRRPRASDPLARLPAADGRRSRRWPRACASLTRAAANPAGRGARGRLRPRLLAECVCATLAALGAP